MDHNSIYVTIGLAVLLAISEALGKSKRFKANGLVQFLAHFVVAGAKGVMAETPVAGIAGVIVSKVGSCVEGAVQEALDQQSTPAVQEALPVTYGPPQPGDEELRARFREPEPITTVKG